MRKSSTQDACAPRRSLPKRVPTVCFANACANSMFCQCVCQQCILPVRVPTMYFASACANNVFCQWRAASAGSPWERTHLACWTYSARISREHVLRPAFMPPGLKSPFTSPPETVMILFLPPLTLVTGLDRFRLHLPV